MTRAVTRFARCSTARRSRAPHAGCLGPGHVSVRGFFASGFPSRRRSWGSAAGGWRLALPMVRGRLASRWAPVWVCRVVAAMRGAVSGSQCRGVELAGRFRKSGQKGYGLRRFECPRRFLARVSPGRGWPEDASGLSGSVNRAVFGQFLGRKALATWSGGCCDPAAVLTSDPPTPPLASQAFSFRERPPNSRPSRKRRRGVRAGASRRAAIDSATRQAPRFCPVAQASAPPCSRNLAKNGALYAPRAPRGAHQPSATWGNVFAAAPDAFESA